MRPPTSAKGNGKPTPVVDRRGAPAAAAMGQTTKWLVIRGFLSHGGTGVLLFLIHDVFFFFFGCSMKNHPASLGYPKLTASGNLRVSLFLALKLDVWQMGRSNLTSSKVSLATNQNDMLVNYDHRGCKYHLGIAQFLLGFTMFTS